MTYTKKEVEDSVLYFAKMFDKLNAYKALLGSHIVLPSLVDMIIKEMFINEYSTTFTIIKKEWEAYKTILEYSKELSKIGFVKFAE